MKKHTLSKPLLACLTVGTFLLGTAAAAGAQQISAWLRPEIDVKIGGETQIMYDKNGSRVYPIEYNGSTYLPVRAVGELLGQTVVWDSSTNTVSLTPQTETPPEQLTYSALDRRVTALEKSARTLQNDVDNTAKASSYAENLTRYRAFDDRRADLSDSASALLVDVREAVRLEKITSSNRTALQNRLTTLYNTLDSLRTTLRDKYGVDDSEAATAKALRAEADALTDLLAELRADVTAAQKADTYAAYKPLGREAQQTYKTLRDRVTSLQLALNDSLRQSVIGYNTYNELCVKADSLDTACKEQKAALDKAEAHWDGSSAPDTGDWADRDAAYYKNRVTSLADEADSLLADCKAYADGKTQDTAKGRTLLRQTDDLSDRIDALEHAIEHSGKVGTKAAWELLRQLDSAEDTVDRAEDTLERAGIDDDWDDSRHSGRHDRDDDDDDWDDDWDD